MGSATCLVTIEDAELSYVQAYCGIYGFFFVDFTSPHWQVYFDELGLVEPLARIYLPPAAKSSYHLLKMPGCDRLCHDIMERTGLQNDILQRVSIVYSSVHNHVKNLVERCFGAENRQSTDMEAMDLPFLRRMCAGQMVAKYWDDQGV